MTAGNAAHADQRGRRLVEARRRRPCLVLAVIIGARLGIDAWFVGIFVVLTALVLTGTGLLLGVVNLTTRRSRSVATWGPRGRRNGIGWTNQRPARLRQEHLATDLATYRRSRR